MLQRVDINEVRARLEEAFMPIDVARVNDSAVRITKIEGEYHWHTHRFSDEFFYILEGEMSIQTADDDLELSPGQGTVVPRGVRHRSKSVEGAVVMVFELITTRKEGDA